MVSTHVNTLRANWTGIIALIAALTLVMVAALGSWALGTLPLSMSLPAVGLLAGAILMVACGASASKGQNGPSAFSAFAVGLMVAGLLGSVVALLQVFAHGWADPDLIAPTNSIGRAPGNVRQPNQLASLLLWALVASVALYELRWLQRAALWIAALILIFALELTSSRMGAVGLLMLFIWGIFDRKLSSTSRWLLTATPGMYGLFYWFMAWYSNAAQSNSLGGRVRGTAALGLGDVDSRLFVWRNAIDLVIDQPWSGVGFGEFRLAWILSPLGYRSGQYFDNAHNIILQLAVELGLPIALLVISLLLFSFWQALRISRKAEGDVGVVARSSLMLVLAVGMHSMVEYPLWYAFFLLPTALAWGMCLGSDIEDLPERLSNTAHKAASETERIEWLFIGGLLMSILGILSLFDYQKVILTYNRPYPNSELAARLEKLQHSILFAHHADYSIIKLPPNLSDISVESMIMARERAMHKSIGTDIMIPWSFRLAKEGDVEGARWLSQRIREFPSAETEIFLAPCKEISSEAFQCQWPEKIHEWREFASRH